MPYGILDKPKSRTCRLCKNEFIATGTHQFMCSDECREEGTRISARKNARRFGLPRKYGITEADYDRMLSEQDNRCKICKIADPGYTRKFFCIDHNHETGAVRGLLCNNCNSGLGRFKDDIKLLEESISYLKVYI